MSSIAAREALERLKEGNRRFVSGSASLDTQATHVRRMEFVAGQEPFAVILGCSDSRVPVEIVFDQGLGDLFVIRVAGNIVAPSQIGSVEFAAERFGTRLVVVLGHTRCGAIQATLDDLQQPSAQSLNLSSIVQRIRPAVEGLLATGLRGHYNGIVLTQADLFTPSGSGFTPEEWQRLHAYERDFGVREAVIAGFPALDPGRDLDYGMGTVDVKTSVTGRWVAPAGTGRLFAYVNTANTVDIPEFSFWGIPRDDPNGPQLDSVDPSDF